MEFEKITALLLKLNAHDKEFLSPPIMKMATEHVIYFFLVYTRFFAFIRNYTPIFGKYFHGKVALEAIKQDKTIAQLSSKYGVHSN